MTSSQDRWPRPVPYGISSGPVTSIMPGVGCCGGTMGCGLINSGGAKYILSCAHVFANDRILGVNNRVTALGDSIRQPGPFDVGCNDNPGDQVGTLVAPWTDLASNTITTPIHADAAIARTTDSLTRFSGVIRSVGIPFTTPVDPVVGGPVKKNGRSTALTFGSISAVNVTVQVGYPDECGSSTGTFVYFYDSFLCYPNDPNVPFGLGGDSGAMICTDNVPVTQTNSSIVGILFAGGGGGAIFGLPMSQMLQFFNGAYSIVGASGGPSTFQWDTPALIAAQQGSAVPQSSSSSSSSDSSHQKPPLDPSDPAWAPPRPANSYSLKFPKTPQGDAVERANRVINRRKDYLWSLKDTNGHGASATQDDKPLIYVLLKVYHDASEYPDHIDGVLIQTVFVGPVTSQGCSCALTKKCEGETAANSE